MCSTRIDLNNLQEVMIVCAVVHSMIEYNDWSITVFLEWTKVMDALSDEQLMPLC